MPRDSNITRLSSLVITPEANDRTNGLYPPILTNSQMSGIPSDEIQVGGIAFNSDTQELMTYTAAQEWVNILTDDMEDANILFMTVITLTATNHITTKDFTVTDTAYIDTLIIVSTLSAPNLFISDTVQTVDLTATGTVQTQDLVVINTAVVGALSVDNTAVFNGDINVAGFTELEADVRIGNFITGGTLAGSTDAGTANPHITVTPDTAVGTGPTIAMEGSPISGSLRILTGTGTSGTKLATFTLPNAAWKQFSAPWGVVIIPASSASSKLAYYVFDQTLATANAAATFTLNVHSDTPLSDTTNYWWNYHIIGNSDTA